MRRLAPLLFALIALWMVGDHPVVAQNPNDNCPEEYRRGIPEVESAREAKKARLRSRGMPERFLHLLDKEECVACIERASDGFHIRVEYNDDANIKRHSFRWNPQSERRVREQLAAGQIKAFYILNTAVRCECCPEVQDDTKTNASYADWNPELEVHMSHVITFDDPSDLGPLPQDLENPPGDWTNAVPNIQEFSKPGRRVLQVTCPACQGLADQLNRQESNRNFLWDKKLTAQERISIIENAIGHRSNEIARLKYQQLFPSTASAAGQQQIEALEEVTEQQQSDIERATRDLAEVDAQIAEVNALMAALMKQIRECEEACRKTTTTIMTGTTDPIVTDTPPAIVGTPRQNAPTTPEQTAPTANAGNPPPVAAKPEPDQAAQPTGAPGATAPAMCPDCDAAAAEVARLNAQISERTAELEQLRALEAGNSANIANLTQLRAAAAGQANAAERVAELEGRIADLQAANRGLRAQQFSAQEEIRTLNEAVAKAIRDLEACNRSCAAATDLPITGTGSTGTGPAKRTVAVNPISPIAICKACEALANQLRTAHAELQRLAQRANDLQIESDFEAFEDQRAKVSELEAALAACNKQCATSTTANTTGDLNTTGANTTPDCVGAACSEEWNACSVTNSCTPIDQDCGVPGTRTCSSGGGNGTPTHDVMDPSGWSTSSNAETEQRIQIKFGDVFIELVIRPMQPAQIGSWFNPLGLLARRLVDNMERWRGSVGPRPLVNPRDLLEVEKYSSGQSMGLPKGVHVLLTDRGGSTGKTLGMQILNLTGQPVRLASMPFAIEPIKQQAQARVQQAFSRLSKAAPVNLDLSAYCVEFLKLPPAANQIFRLAPASVQKKYEAMSKVLRSAYRVQHAGLLRPDSNPAGYTDSIKQWAVWAVEQKFNEARFTDAFLGHTRKNVEAAGQPWSKPAEEMLRKISPNRWRDIVKVLSGAGVAVPQ